MGLCRTVARDGDEIFLVSVMENEAMGMPSLNLVLDMTADFLFRNSRPQGPCLG